ncbi:LuxR C-terminal-related transcriptional regulator [Hydrogenibacillus sp. N12]|uniref:helix-turn-helix transcriptional regulator n=1 Tax=Hydrogenibacillus sp. N12 TaxID=2866627 RepID=UPI001C7D682C|nr:LuxR C-terminal-related transcriptional regulator [Hydrogenibacillus sp. N12]QZA32064.1 LuxR C-terminal-related transcriptional regulator [Hydrogenibacillus sp. N12]
MAEQIEREPRDEEEYSTSLEAPLAGQEGEGVTVSSSSWKVVRPSLAVRIPGSVATKLSVREKEVLELLAAGASTGEIARKLHLSRSTIKTHLARIAEKLGIEPGMKSILMFIDRFAR